MSEMTRVLVVEDEEHVRLALQYNLQMEGFDVHLAKDGRSGLEAIERVQPEVILCDWMMPDMNGVEVVRELKANPETRHLPVFMLTPPSMLQDVDEALEAGVVACIGKPFDPLSLGETLRQKLAEFQRA